MGGLHTFPSAYRLGLKRTVLFPVVARFTNIGWLGYSRGKKTSQRKHPFAYGVSAGPVINTYRDLQ